MQLYDGKIDRIEERKRNFTITTSDFNILLSTGRTTNYTEDKEIQNMNNTTNKLDLTDIIRRSTRR